MTPISELTGPRLALLLLCALVITVVLTLFAALMIREYWLDLRAWWSKRGQLVPAAYNVRQEYELKDPPAWHRLPAHKTWRLRGALRDFHE